jgi:hypothetical protein
MSNSTGPFQVLVVTSAAQVVLGTDLDSLLEGQLGAYDYETNLAIVAPTKKFYLAVGIKDALGQADINKSAGNAIQNKHVAAYITKQYIAPVDMITSNVMEVLTCGDEVGVRVEIRNQEAYRLNGYNQVVKTFLVPTSECGDCDASCEDLDCVAILASLVALINSDTDQLFTASSTAPTDCTTGDGKLILTVNSASFGDFCSINLNYFSPRQTEIIVTPLNGFEPTVVDTDMVYEQGSGYDVKQLEYEAGGWNGRPGPYRTLVALGVTREGFLYFSDVNANYAIQNIHYDNVSISGWEKNFESNRTVVAAPNGAVSTAVTIFLDLIFPDA